jgi:hypothetical protein
MGLRQRLPAVEIVILSGHLPAACVGEALREDAAGYLDYPAPLPLLKGGSPASHPQPRPGRAAGGKRGSPGRGCPATSGKSP